MKNVSRCALILSSVLALAHAGLAYSAGNVEAGRAVFERHNCASCHGNDAKTSIDPSYPQLAGQAEDYLRHSLRAYRRGQAGMPARANVRKNPVMGAFAIQLSEQEITDVAAFLASLPGNLQTR